MEYTKEQLVAALKRAAEAGDTQAANEIADYLDANFAEAAPEPKAEPVKEDKSLLQRWGESFGEASSKIDEIEKKTQEGETGYLSGVWQAGGAVFGGLASGIGDVIAEGYEEFTTDNFKKTVEETARDLLNTEAGRKLAALAKEGGEAWENWAADHPEAAGNIEAALERAQFMPIGKAAKGSKSVITKWGDDIIRGAEKIQRANKIDDILTPRFSKKGKVDVRKFNAEGKYVPDASDNAIRKTVYDYTDVKADSGPIDSLVSVDKGIEKEAIKLKARLSNVEQRSSIKGVSRALNNRLQSEGLGDIAATKYMRQQLDELLAQSDGSAKSLLEVRQKLDKAMRDRYKNIFSEGVDERKAAMRITRDYINDRVAAMGRAAGVDVEDSLAIQRRLYSAQDIVEGKAADFVSDAQKVADALAKDKKGTAKLMMEAAKTVSHAGVATFLFNEAVAGGVAAYAVGGLGAVLAGKLAVSMARRGITASDRKFLGKVIKAMGQTGENLAVQRAAIIEAMKLPTVPEVEEEEETTNQQPQPAPQQQQQPAPINPQMLQQIQQQGQANMQAMGMLTGR